MSLWKSEVRSIWNRARSEAKCAWGLWRAIPIGDEWAVEDYNNRRIMETKHEHVAKLVAQMPELMERDLRPGEVLHVTSPTGANKPIPDMESVGLMTEQEAYDMGYASGYDKGVADQELVQEEAEDRAYEDSCPETEATIDPAEIEKDPLPADVRQALTEYEALLSRMAED